MSWIHIIHELGKTLWRYYRAINTDVVRDCMTSISLFLTQLQNYNILCVASPQAQHGNGVDGEPEASCSTFWSLNVFERSHRVWINTLSQVSDEMKAAEAHRNLNYSELMVLPAGGLPECISASEIWHSADKQVTRTKRDCQPLSVGGLREDTWLYGVIKATVSSHALQLFLVE